MRTSRRKYRQEIITKNLAIQRYRKHSRKPHEYFSNWERFVDRNTFVSSKQTAQRRMRLRGQRLPLTLLVFAELRNSRALSISISFFPSSRGIRYSIRVTGQRHVSVAIAWDPTIKGESSDEPIRAVRFELNLRSNSPPPSLSSPSATFVRKVVYSRTGTMTGIEFTGESTIRLRNNRLAKRTRREEKMQEIAFASRCCPRLLPGVIRCNLLSRGFLCIYAESPKLQKYKAFNVWTTTIDVQNHSWGIANWRSSLPFRRIDLCDVIDLIVLWFFITSWFLYHSNVSTNVSFQYAVYLHSERKQNFFVYQSLWDNRRMKESNGKLSTISFKWEIYISRRLLSKFL